MIQVTLKESELQFGKFTPSALWSLQTTRGPRAGMCSKLFPAVLILGPVQVGDVHAEQGLIGGAHCHLTKPSGGTWGTCDELPSHFLTKRVVKL